MILDYYIYSIIFIVLELKDLKKVFNTHIV